MSANKQIGDEKFVVHQKKCNADKKPFSDHEKLEAMTTAVTKMAHVLRSQKNANYPYRHGMVVESPTQPGRMSLTIG